MIESVCEICGKQIFVKPYMIRNGRGRFCSQKCYGEFLHRQPSKKVERQCENCGRIFYVKPSQMKYRKAQYCSRKCAFQAKYTGQMKICLFCGKQFYVQNNILRKGFGKYCSQNCYHAATNGEANPHWKGGITDKIKLRCAKYAWRELRKIILKRDKYRCLRCHAEFKSRQLAIHHMLPVRLGGCDDPKNLVTLCYLCHGYVESRVVT